MFLFCLQGSLAKQPFLALACSQPFQVKEALKVNDFYFCFRITATVSVILLVFLQVQF